MMRENEVTDAMLMSYADGELPQEEAAAVARAIQARPELARRAEEFARSRAFSKAAFAELLAAPPPDRLIEPVLRQAGSRTPSRSAWLLPLAAAVTIAAGGAGWWMGGAGRPAQKGTLALAFDASQLSRPLQRAASGARQDLDGGSLLITGSFRTPEGLCRTFELGREGETARGLACRSGNVWTTRAAMLSPVEPGGIVPATDGTAAALDAYLDGMAAESPLSPEEEKAALEATSR